MKSNLKHIIRCVGEDIQIEKEIKYGMRLDKKINELMLKYLFIHQPLLQLLILLKMNTKNRNK